MHSFRIAIIALCASFAVANPLNAPNNQLNAIKDSCPKDEIACLDVMNCSQCIEQLIIEKQAPATKEALIKCIETEGSASTLPGATRVSSSRKTRLTLRRTTTLKDLEKDFRLTNPSSVDAQDAIASRSTMQLRNCFQPRALEVDLGENLFAWVKNLGNAKEFGLRIPVSLDGKDFEERKQGWRTNCTKPI